MKDLDFNELRNFSADPSANPGSGFVFFYAKNGDLYVKSSGGTVTKVGSAIIDMGRPFGPNDALIPSSNGPDAGARNNTPTLDYDDTTAETAYFNGMLSMSYSGGDLKFVLVWAAKSATTGTMEWSLGLARLDEAGADLDDNNYPIIPIESAVTAPSTSGQLVYQLITLSGSRLDGIQAGEFFQLKLVGETGGTMSGDAQFCYLFPYQ